MADSTGTRPPVAIRIVRPYQTEDEFLEHELETVGKTSVILVGAHARPAGVILRFEVTLATGATILRGEGRVLAHKEHAFRGQPGLSLRFTRLDAKSKALVDRAAAIRAARAAGDPAPMAAQPTSTPSPASSPAPPASDASPASSPSSASSPATAGAVRPASVRPPAVAADRPASVRPPAVAADRPASVRPPAVAAGRPASVRPPAPTQPDASLEEALTAETPQPSRASRPPRSRSVRPAPHHDSVPPQAPAGVRRSEPPRGERPSELASPSAEPIAAARGAASALDASTPSGSGTARTVERPANRDDLLARLRSRASALPPERVDAILASRR